MENTSPGGYTCTNCGMWVYYNSYHRCGSTGTVPVPTTFSEWIEDKSVKNILEDILEVLRDIRCLIRAK